MYIVIDREDSMKMLQWLVNRHNLNVVSTEWVNKKWRVEVQQNEIYTNQREKNRNGKEDY